MRNRNTLVVLSFCLFALVALEPPVVAQEGDAAEAEPAAVPLTPEVALARLCISEAGWECFDTGDGLGIHEVILRGAEHQAVRYTSYARAYARRLFGARPHDVARLRWVGQLTPSCTEPEAGPEMVTHHDRDGSVSLRPHAPWRSYRARCLAVFERAAEVVESMTLANMPDWAICERPVHDWGGWMDRSRAERIGLVEVNCDRSTSSTNEAGEEVTVLVETANDFYCRPSLDENCAAVDRD